jgi:hypothetical protein
MSKLNKNDNVNHREFGAGTVVEVEGAKITVKFKDFTKIILESYLYMGEVNRLLVRWLLK